MTAWTPDELDADRFGGVSFSRGYDLATYQHLEEFGELRFQFKEYHFDRPDDDHDPSDMTEFDLDGLAPELVEELVNGSRSELKLMEVTRDPQSQPSRVGIAVPGSLWGEDVALVESAAVAAYREWLAEAVQEARSPQES